MDINQNGKDRIRNRIKKTSGDFRMTNWMWAKPGKYKIKTQRTLEDFPQEEELSARFKEICKREKSRVWKHE